MYVYVVLTYGIIQLQHATTLFTLPTGVWTSPTTTGDKPPPCYNFSFTSIDNRRAILFGGWNTEQGRMNDIYIIDLQERVSKLNTGAGCVKVW